MVFISIFYTQAQDIISFDKQYTYYHGDLSPKSTIQYEYYIPAGEIGVFTLKSKYSGSGSDLDLYVYSSYSTELGTSNTTGPQPEVVYIMPSDYGRHVNVRAENYENYTASYKFYAHSFNPYDKMIEAGIMSLVKLLFSGEDSSWEQKSNLDRGVNIANSIIRGYDLSTSTRSLMLNELSIGLQNELGYGALAEFVVDSVLLIFDDIYKYYW